MRIDCTRLPKSRKNPLFYASLQIRGIRLPWLRFLLQARGQNAHCIEFIGDLEADL
jgi:hypothetical protein